MLLGALMCLKVCGGVAPAEAAAAEFGVCVIKPPRGRAAVAADDLERYRYVFLAAALLLAGSGYRDLLLARGESP